MESGYFPHKSLLLIKYVIDDPLQHIHTGIADKTDVNWTCPEKADKYIHILL